MKAKFTIFILLALIALVMEAMICDRLSGLNGAALMLILVFATFAILPATNDADGAKKGLKSKAGK